MTTSAAGGALSARRLPANLAAAMGLAWRAAPLALGGYALATLVLAVAPVASVGLLRDLLNSLADGHRSDRAMLTVLLIAAGLAATLLPALLQYLHSEINRRTGQRARDQLYQAVERQTGLARLEDPSFRDQLQLATQGGRFSPVQIVEGMLGFGQGGLMILGYVAILAAANELMAIIAVAVVGPALIAEIRISRARADTLWQITPRERREIFYSELLISLPAAKEVRLLGLSGLFRRRMLDELGVSDGERRRLDRRDLRTQAGLAVMSAAVAGGGLVWTVVAAGQGRLDVGDVAAYLGGIGGLQAALMAQVGRVSTTHQALLAFSHYRAVLTVPPDLPVASTPRTLPPLRSGIELRDVWFRYGPDQPWILHGVDLVIPHGRSLALVGLNGAGKSTLVKLLCRFYDPQQGCIAWDGTDIRDVDVAELRTRMGVVFQDYMSYELSAAENIGLGDLDALDDEARIRSAARKAGIDATLDQLPSGYQTMLSRMFVDAADAEDPNTGVLLSGGQWQRMALARAFLRDRRDLLILDEPSSGLDAEAEHEIHQRLQRHRREATSVLISHRLGAIRDADQIVVLAGGRIVEQGTHNQLMAAHGEYARLFGLQARGYRDDEPAGAA